MVVKRHTPMPQANLRQLLERILRIEQLVVSIVTEACIKPGLQRHLKRFILGEVVLKLVEGSHRGPMVKQERIICQVFVLRQPYQVILLIQHRDGSLPALVPIRFQNWTRHRPSLQPWRLRDEAPLVAHHLIRLLGHTPEAWLLPHIRSAHHLPWRPSCVASKAHR